MARFRVGIIGMGTVAHTHVKALKKIDDVSIAAIADIKDKSELDIPEGAEYFSDYRTMIDEVKPDISVFLIIFMQRPLNMPLYMASAFFVRSLWR